MRPILSFLLLLCLLQGCRKDPPTVVDLEIDGLTYRDMNADVFCLPDSTDWQLLDQWDEWESSLFAGRPSGPAPVSAPDTFLFFAFPNPSVYGWLIHTNQDSTSYFDMRIVNRQREILWSQNNITGNSLYLSPTSIAFSPDSSELVRAYYRVIRSNGTVYQGHGDLKRAAFSCP